MKTPVVCEDNSYSPLYTLCTKKSIHFEKKFKNICFYTHLKAVRFFIFHTAFFVAPSFILIRKLRLKIAFTDIFLVFACFAYYRSFHYVVESKESDSYGYSGGIFFAYHSAIAAFALRT